MPLSLSLFLVFSPNKWRASTQHTATTTAKGMRAQCFCAVREANLCLRRKDLSCRFFAPLSKISESCGMRRGFQQLTATTRSLNDTRRSFHCTFHEPITPELITIEVMTGERHSQSPSPSIAGDDSHLVHETQCLRRPTAAPLSSSSSTSSVHCSAQYTDVSSIDLFCKGKVTNYLRRVGHTTSLFEHSKDTGVDGTLLFRCRVKLTLPPPHRGMFVAEGLGENEKDAENLAAMHAERIMDALGVQLFRLPSMQLKHAEAARKLGRFAPLPDDPVKPEGTAVPPPFRMVAAAAIGTGSVAPSEGSSTDNVHHGMGRLNIAEAEIVVSAPLTVPLSDSCCSSSREHDSAAAPPTTDPSVATAPQPLSSPPPLHPYAMECHFPWRTGPQGGDSNNPSSKCNNVFDPTENGMWQLCNVMSSRMSPSPDALLFPVVFEKEAYNRLAKEYFLFGHGEDIKRFIHISQVAVAGYASRMFVAEIKLLDGITVSGRGKAQDKECATHLAAMHAELLIDALGKRLFPKDNSRQALHAIAAADFGRWAQNPVTGDVEVPSSVRGAPLPLPLKQQAGGDEVWLDPHANRRNRTLGERVIFAHNDLYQETNDMAEVNPPQELLDEARRLLRDWQRTIAGNMELRNCFVVTKMGDFYRANTLLPVPRKFGIRGGCAVGRSVEQAIDLASLHALDVLCSLGVPIMLDTEQEKLLMERRQANGQVTYETMQRCAPAHNDPAAAEPTGRHLVKYLPGYIIEGNAVRKGPHIADLLYAWQLKIDTRNLAGSDFVALSEYTDEQIISEGNDIKSNLTMYFNRVAKRGADPSVFISGQAMKASVYNVAFLSLPFPPQEEMPKHERPNDERRIVAVGLSLKKKDAERMCYFHANMLLKMFGIELRKEREIFNRIRKEGKAVKLATDVVVGNDHGSGGSRIVVDVSELPRPLMHPVFKSHHETARGLTPPKKKISPNPY